MKKILSKILAFAIVASPALAFAQNFSSVTNAISSVESIVNSLIPLVIGIGVLVFLWGLVSFLTAGADEEKRGEARTHMIWGIVVLFVMVSVWGLVNILVNTFGTGGSNVPETIPQVPTQ